MLLPLERVRWRGRICSNHVALHFDGRGQPTEFGEFALPLAVPEREAA